jgi:hypothetical protein
MDQERITEVYGVMRMRRAQVLMHALIWRGTHSSTINALLSAQNVNFAF